MNDESSMADPLGPIVEQFTHEVREGKRPRVDDYTARYPALADQLRQVLPVLAMMEKAKDETTGNGMSMSPPAEAMRRNFGGYRIFREIGRGGMGVVYEAEQESLGRHVALKVLPHPMAHDAQMVARFQREARAAAQLHHTNIVPVFEVGRDGDTYFYAMQFIRGLGLDEVLNQVRELKGSSGKGGKETPPKPASRMSEVAQSLWTGAFTLDLAPSNKSRPFNPSAPESNATDEKSSSGSSWVLPSSLRRSPRDADTAESTSRTAARRPEDRIKSVLKQATVFTKPQDRRGLGRRPDSSVVSFPGHGELSSADSDFHHYARSVANVGHQVANALSYAHARGIIHRDIKPSNLLLDAAGVVWVTDFGLAKTIEDGLTRTGHMLGTLRYMSPERFEGVCDVESDIYSLGVTLYEMLTLRPVFESRDRLELIRIISETEPIRPRLLEPRIPRDLETIVLKAMDKQPRSRYRSASAFAADLNNFLNDEPIWARRISAPERFFRWARRNRGTAGLLSMIALLLVLVASLAANSANHYRRLLGEKESLAAAAQRLADEMSDRTKEVERERQQAIVDKESAQRHLYYSQIHVAAQAWESHRGVVRMQKLLDQWRPAPNARDFRGWEWYYLWGLLQRSARTISVQGKSVGGVSFHPRNGDIAAGNDDGIVRVWDPRTGRVAYGYRAHLRDVLSVAWSPDGALIATSGREGSVRVHNPTQRTDITLTQNHTADVLWVTWHPDGKFIASASRDGTVRVCSIESGQEVAELIGDDQGFCSATWNPDGTQIAAAGDSGEIFVWDWQKGELLRRWPAHPRTVRSIAWSPDGNMLASGSEDHTIRIWNAATGELSRELLGHSHYVTALRWNHGSELLASVSNDQTLRLWSAKEGRQIRVLRGHTDQITSVDWSASDQLLVSAGLDHELKLWDATTELESYTYRGHAGAQSCAAVRFGPRGNRIASVAADHTIHIWEPDTGSRLHELTGHTAMVTSLAWHPLGDKLASSSEDGTLWMWNSRSGVPIQKVMKSPSGILAIAFDHDGQYLAAAAGDGTVFVLDAETLKELATIKEHQGVVRAVTWHPTSPLLATGGDDHVILFWNAADGASQGKLTGDAAVLSLDWSPDGKWLAAGCNDFNVVIWDLAKKETHLRLLGHNDLVKSVSWSTDGLRLATSSVDGTLRIWDTEVGAEAMTLHGHDKAIHDVDWGSDGMRLASASEDATVRIWNAFAGYEDQRSKDLLPVLNRRIQENPSNITDLELRRRLLLYHGMVDEARQDRQRIIELYDHQIESDHFLEGVAEKLSAILLESDDEWHVIVPDEAKSQEGATLIPQPDQSIVVEGFNPDWDKYTVTGAVHGLRVTALRLEAIPDQRLPGGGSGRFSGSGNFHLSEVRARGLLSSNAPPAELYFLRAVADFSSSQSPVENAIDDDLATTWDIWPSQTDRHVAVFELGEPWELPPGDRASLEVTLEFHHPFWMSHNLGRFRISVTASPRPVLREQLRVSLASSRIDGRVRLAGAYYLAGEYLKAEHLLTSVPDETAGDNGYAVVLRALISRQLEREDAPQLRRDASEWIRLRSTRDGRAVPLQLPE